MLNEKGQCCGRKPITYKRKATSTAPESSQLRRDDDANHFRCGARAAKLADQVRTCITV